MRIGSAPRHAAESAVAVLLGLGLLPILAGIGAAIWFAMGPPVIFRDRRIGHLGRAFTLYKFRTMSSRTGAGGRLLADAQRITKLGKFLRNSSLDELPQLWNVLRGDMGLVGPRPLLEEYLPRYSARQRRRHDVRPGITGYAQVRGRNALTWDRKFDLDIWYVEHRSLWLDIKIICLTLRGLLIRDGISQPGYATMPEFLGKHD